MNSIIGQSAPHPNFEMMGLQIHHNGVFQSMTEKCKPTYDEKDNG